MDCLKCQGIPFYRKRTGLNKKQQTLSNRSRYYVGAETGDAQ